MTLLEKIKLALRISHSRLDAILADDIESAKADLELAGVVLPTTLDAICERAIMTYVAMLEGDKADYDRLKRSYDEQKAQLSMNRNYTNYDE